MGNSVNSKNQVFYDDFIKELNSQGLKTTNINQGKEANFSTYGFALSEDLRNQIVDSFDNERDYQIQSDIAGLFKGSGTNFLNSSNFIASCQSLGYKVSLSYVSTSYISDYKNGNFSNSVGQGHIGVYTISDGMGGEITLADANGNGGLEIEEVFMNDILTEVVKDISVTPGLNATHGSSSGSGLGENGEEKVTQDEFNGRVEALFKAGLSEDQAVSTVQIETGSDTFDYTGIFIDQFEKEEAKAEKEEAKAKKEEEKAKAEEAKAKDDDTKTKEQKAEEEKAAAKRELELLFR